MDASSVLARNIVATKFEDLPAAVVDITRKEILDTIGVALAGSAALGVAELVELIKEWGGKKEATIFCFGGKVPAGES